MNTNTCGQCSEFDNKTNICNCPLNAFPSYDSYVYNKTTEETKACGFFYLKVVK
jgi:hypothetical protein